MEGRRMKDHFKAAHFVYGRIAPGSLINIGGRCGMMKDNEQLCDYESGKLPDLYRHIRTMHLGTQPPRKTCGKKNAVDKGISMQSSGSRGGKGKSRNEESSNGQRQSGSRFQPDGEQERRYPKRTKKNN